MIYLWEALLCIRMAQIPEKTIQFVHAPHGSPYMEMALPCLNQTWLEDIVEVNTYYRFYSIFKNMFPPEQAEFPALRDSLTNLALHMIAQNDVIKGIWKKKLHVLTCRLPTCRRSGQLYGRIAKIWTRS